MRVDRRARIASLPSTGAALLMLLACAEPAAAVCGDLNGSQDVSATDALVCLQGAVGTISLDGRCEPAANCGPVFPPCGDVTGDDVASATDCLVILKAGTGVEDISSSCDCEGIELCGNEVVDDGEGETCDDGNLDDGDGCSSTCQSEGPIDVCAGVDPAAGTSVASQLVASGLNVPLYVTAPPNDVHRVFVVQQDGIVRTILDGALQPTPFMNLQDRVFYIDCCEEEVGLLSIAFHPDYANNGWVFVNYSNFSGNTVISRFDKMAGVDAVDPLSEKILLTITQNDIYHNGGQLQFGPDGYLWIGMGDGNGDLGGDPAGNAQNDGTLLGKMLRVDVDVDVPPYWAVPPDNPNPGVGQTALIWSKGLRNPWRFSFDRETGDMIIADVGQDAVEEIDFQPSSSTGGENYAWNYYEGTSCFAGTPCPSPSQFVAPIHEYAHTGAGGSVTGGYVYRGCAMPDLHGTYFYADFVQGFVRSFVVSNGQATSHADRTAELDPPGAASLGLVASFGEDAQGELYIVDWGDGEVYKIVPD